MHLEFNDPQGWAFNNPVRVEWYLILYLSRNLINIYKYYLIQGVAHSLLFLFEKIISIS